MKLQRIGTLAIALALCVGCKDAAPPAASDTTRDGTEGSVPSARDVVHQPELPPSAPPDRSPGDAGSSGAPDVATDDIRPDAASPAVAIAVEEGAAVIPQTNLHLRADIPAGADTYEWRVDQPPGSRSVFLPSHRVAEPRFEANVAGAYTFHLDVWRDGERLGETALYRVEVTPAQTIHLELTWTTPGDPDETDTGPFAGADMDLHFVRPGGPTDPSAPDLDGDGLPDPYFDPGHDCYWFAPGPAGPNAPDGPSLDRDDTDGAGPENINWDTPVAGERYEVAVHYWNDHAYGPSTATVRIYIDGELTWHDSLRVESYDLWCAAFIDWPVGTVTPCVNADGGRKVTPDYLHPMFYDSEPSPPQCEDGCPDEAPYCHEDECVACVLDRQCPFASRCDADTYECVPVPLPICDADCARNGCPAAPPYELACDETTGCCFDPRGFCKGDAIPCDPLSGSQCQPLDGILAAVPDVAGIPAGVEGLCTCDPRHAEVCEDDPPSECRDIPGCLGEDASCVRAADWREGVFGDDAPPLLWLNNVCWGGEPAL